MAQVLAFDLGFVKFFVAVYDEIFPIVCGVGNAKLIINQERSHITVD